MQPGVGGDDHLRRVGVEPIAQRTRRKAREDGVEQGADAKARQHRDDRFGQIRREDRDGVTPGDPEPSEDIGALVDLGRQHPVGEEPALPVFPLPDQRQAVVGAGGQMSIDEIERGVADAANKIPEVGKLTLEHRVPRTQPHQLVGDVGPELFGLLMRLLEQRLKSLDAAAVGQRRTRRVGIIQPAVANHAQGFAVSVSHAGCPFAAASNRPVTGGGGE
jgi:hypothetical protein